MKKTLLINFLLALSFIPFENAAHAKRDDNEYRLERAKEQEPVKPVSEDINNQSTKGCNPMDPRC